MLDALGVRIYVIQQMFMKFLVGFLLTIVLVLYLSILPLSAVIVAEKIGNYLEKIEFGSLYETED